MYGITLCRIIIIFVSRYRQTKFEFNFKRNFVNQTRESQSEGADGRTLCT